MTDIRSDLLRFAGVVLVVDVLGLGLWRLLPPETQLRAAVLFGTLVVAPLLGFLLVYAPAVANGPETD
jgi:quinol-cytochrome oxidoreductase complex cytochrome b subunit